MSLLYSGANISRKEIDLLPTPPALGRFHNPYPFGRYIDDIEEALDLNGLVIANQEFEVTHDNNRLFGALEVAPKTGELITSDEWKFLIGLRGSHDQRIPRGLSVGSSILVCSNLCFSGSLGTFHTKQTTNVGNRIPQLIREAVERIPEAAALQEKQFNAYKELELTPPQGDAALVEIYRRGGFNPSQLTRAVKEWDEPSYIDHEHADAGDKSWSGWRLFNASTQALKPTGETHNTDTIRQRSEVITGFLNEGVGL